jgi:hypothetical protein
MLTRERSVARPFLKLSAIGLTSSRFDGFRVTYRRFQVRLPAAHRAAIGFTAIGLRRYTPSVSCRCRFPSFLYRLYRPSLRHHPLVAQAGDAGRPQAFTIGSNQDDFNVRRIFR